MKLSSQTDDSRNVYKYARAKCRRVILNSKYAVTLFSLKCDLNISNDVVDSKLATTSSRVNSSDTNTGDELTK